MSEPLVPGGPPRAATAPRIPPVTAPDADQAAALAKALPRADGAPLNIFATLAHVPRLLRRVNGLGGYFAVHGKLPARDRELAVLRTAARTGSAYEAAHHRTIGAAVGLTPEEIEAALAVERAAPADMDAPSARSDAQPPPAAAHPWSPADAALLAATDELVAHRTVTDATWAALVATHHDHERLELLVLVGFYAMLAGVIDAAGIELDPVGPATS